MSDFVLCQLKKKHGLAIVICVAAWGLAVQRGPRKRFVVFQMFIIFIHSNASRNSKLYIFFIGLIRLKTSGPASPSV